MDKNSPIIGKDHPLAGMLFLVPVFVIADVVLVLLLQLFAIQLVHPA
jgi:hypothetical protein